MNAIKKLFIVEDNPLYAKQLSKFITNKFDNKLNVKTFVVSETCMMSMHENPDIIIMDHVLNTKFHDAEEGYNALIQIKKDYPSIKLILHSGTMQFLNIDPNICNEIPKDENSLVEIEKYLNHLI